MPASGTTPNEGLLIFLITFLPEALEEDLDEMKLTEAGNGEQLGAIKRNASNLLLLLFCGGKCETTIQLSNYHVNHKCSYTFFDMDRMPIDEENCASVE
jgi:hypothetical protein